MDPDKEILLTDLGLSKHTMDWMQVEHRIQIDKWGVQSHTMDRWMTIIGEEIGELNKAVLEADNNNREEIWLEALQCATLCAKFANMVLHGIWTQTRIEVNINAEDKQTDHPL